MKRVIIFLFSLIFSPLILAQNTSISTSPPSVNDNNSVAIANSTDRMQYQVVDCPSPYTGSIKQARIVKNISGQNFYSDWGDIQNTCQNDPNSVNNKAVKLTKTDMSNAPLIQLTVGDIVVLMVAFFIILYFFICALRDDERERRWWWF